MKVMPNMWFIASQDCAIIFGQRDCEPEHIFRFNGTLFLKTNWASEPLH